jgi:hypothetical protein
MYTADCNIPSSHLWVIVLPWTTDGRIIEKKKSLRLAASAPRQKRYHHNYCTTLPECVIFLILYTYTLLAACLLFLYIHIALHAGNARQQWGIPSAGMVGKQGVVAPVSSRSVCQPCFICQLLYHCVNANLLLLHNLPLHNLPFSCLSKVMRCLGKCWNIMPFHYLHKDIPKHLFSTV